MVNSQLILALIMAAFIGSAAGYLGSLMLTKKMALAGGALGHLTLPGMALALIYGFDVSLGALIFLVLGVGLIWWLEGKTKISMEALTAVVFSSSLAVAFLFLPQDKTAQALIGDISQISLLTTLVIVAASFVVFLVARKIFGKMILINISPEIAQSQGISLKKYNFIYLACVALTVALSVRVVGGLMTAALVAIPAATSRNLAKNLFQYSYGGLLFGLLSSVVGILIFYLTKLPAGPMIIINSAFFFVASLFLKEFFARKNER